MAASTLLGRACVCAIISLLSFFLVASGEEPWQSSTDWALWSQQKIIGQNGATYVWGAEFFGIGGCPEGSVQVMDWSECQQIVPKPWDEDEGDNYVWPTNYEGDYDTGMPCGCIIDDYVIRSNPGEYFSGDDQSWADIGFNHLPADLNECQTWPDDWEYYAPICRAQEEPGKCESKPGSKWANWKCKKHCDFHMPTLKGHCHSKCRQYCNTDCRCSTNTCSKLKDDEDWSISKPKKHKGKGCSWLATQDPDKLKKLCRRFKGKGLRGKTQAALQACAYTCAGCVQTPYV